MKKILISSVFLLVTLVSGCTLGDSAVKDGNTIDIVPPPLITKDEATTTPLAENAESVSVCDLSNNPITYVEKKVKIKATLKGIADDRRLYLLEDSNCQIKVYSWTPTFVSTCPPSVEICNPPATMSSYTNKLLDIEGILTNEGANYIFRSNEVNELREASAAEETQNCATIGESPNVIDLRTGEAVPGGKSCCPSLKRIDQSPLPEDGKTCAFSQGNPGICAPCGNGKCENQYKENRCNCSEDCH